MAKEATNESKEEILFSNDDQLIDCIRHTYTNRSASQNGLPVTLYGIRNTPYSVEGGVSEDFCASYKLYDMVNGVYTKRDYGYLVKVPATRIEAEVLYRSNFRQGITHPDTVLARNRAITGASRRAEALSLVMLAETQKTVVMVRGLIYRIFNWLMDIYRSLKRFQFKKLFDITSDIWLEARYGWRPLVGEIQNIRDAIKPMRKLGIHASYGSDIQEHKVRDCSSHHQAFNLSVFNLDHKTTHKSGVKSGFTYLLQEESFVLDRLGLHMDSLLNTAWELVPFSFILDWFIDLGGYLSQNAAISVEPHNSYDTLFEEYEIVSTLRPSSRYEAMTEPTVTQRGTSFSRTIPFAQHGYSHQFNASLSWDQSADLLAIANKIISGIFRK